MMYVDFEAGNKAYKLRLNTRSIVSLEKQLGCNPIAIFGDGSTLPTVESMVNVLYAALQPLNHGITLNDAYDIFDASGSSACSRKFGGRGIYRICCTCTFDNHWNNMVYG